MSDPIDRHIDNVRQMTRRGGPLDPGAPTASVNNPAWFRHGEPRAERIAVHDSIRARLLEAVSPESRNDRRALVLAGPPGAGKSTLREGVLAAETAGFLEIDPDEIKSLLVRHALDDGSLRDFVKPEQVRALESAGERFFPLELSGLFHLEARSIAEDLRASVMPEGVPLVIDGVLPSADVAVALGHELQDAGYAIDVVVADVPFEVSEDRIRTRWREAYELTVKKEADGTASKDADLLGGRWVPSDYVRFVFEGPDGRSRPLASAERLAHEVGAVERLRVFRTPAIGAATDLVTDLGRVRPDRPLLGGEAARAHQAAFGRGRARPPRPPQRDTGYGR